MDTIEAFYALYNRGDLDAAMELFTPDALLDNCALGQTYEGAPAIRGFWDEFAEIVEEPRAEPVARTVDDDIVIVDVQLKGRTRHTGLTEDTIPTRVVHGLRLDGDKIAWWAICWTKEEVLRAAGRHE